MKRATSIRELQSELEGQITYTAEQEFTARVLLFIAEHLGDPDRLSQIEREMENLRSLIQTVQKQANDGMDDARHLIDERMPKIKGERLMIEADDGQGSTVDAYVDIAEIVN